MKRYLVKMMMLLMVLTTILACRKKEELNVDFSKYNMDDPTGNTPLDQWLTSNFLDPYNIDVIYKYKRYQHGTDRNVAPVKTEYVQPQMQGVLDFLIKPYQKVGGIPFIKRAVPKQFVLYGSTSYELDNSSLLGTLAGGSTMTLYLTNNFDLNDLRFMGQRAGTLHHEFVHAINSIVPVPPDFELISKGNYDASWSSVTQESARNRGFISSYAGSSPEEDFAETVSRLVRRGQVWYDTQVAASTDAGRIALRAKEENVTKYFKDNFKIELKDLQKEVNSVLEDKYNVNWLTTDEDAYTILTIDMANAIYNTYAMPNGFTTLYNNLRAGIAAKNFTMTSVRFVFSKATSGLTVKVLFTNTSNTQYTADYLFTYSVRPQEGIVFTKVAQGTGGNATNAARFTTEFGQTLQAYLTEGTFKGSWLYNNIYGATNSTNIYGGFYKNGAPNDYFYGLLTN